MPVLQHPQRQAADVEREPASDITPHEGANIQLYMTYIDCVCEADVSPEVLAWLDATCEETGANALEVLIAAAELCADMK